MTARSTPTTLQRTDSDDPPLDSLDVAAEHIAASALRDGPVERVGLELEAHLVSLERPAQRPGAAAIATLLAALPPLPHGSPVTEEPGGQIELSPRPERSVAVAVSALRTDRAALREALAGHGYGSASVGADPLRPLAVVNPAARYAAMQEHWATVGCADSGRAMMAASAALQVNLDAGPVAGWTARVEHLHRIGPVLLAMSACSPMLAGSASGWASMRQQAWAGIDPARSGRIPTGEPIGAWTRYALAAPVMLVRDHDGCGASPVPSRVSFASWVSGAAKLVRRPTLRDLDYHLTTLYPAVRPRGYLELRCLDAVPDRWWPGLATVTTVLADDPVAADLADEACEPVADAWLCAARDGLRDDRIWHAARRCVHIAAQRSSSADLHAYADLIDARRTPGDDLRERIDSVGPAAALLEAARA